MTNRFSRLSVRPQHLALFLCTFVLLLPPRESHCAPYMGKALNAVQPDGSTVEVRLFGDEFYMRAETPNGYTVVRDGETGWLCYARYSDTQEELVSTGIPYTGISEVLQRTDFHSRVGSKRQTLPVHRFLDKVNRNYQRLYPHSTNVASVDLSGAELTVSPPDIPLPPPTGEVSGEVISLSVVVDFSDAPATMPLSAYEGYLNGFDWQQDGNSMSVNRYFHEVSYGKLNVRNIVYGIFRASRTFAQYDNMSYGSGAQEILRDVLTKMDNEGFDFSQLTTTPDGTIKALNIIYAGNPKNWAQGMWYHQGWFRFDADGVHTERYACGSANAPLDLGLTAHENGHMIGNWPDVYLYDGGTNPVGDFCIMASGGRFPPPPNAAFRTMAGWTEVVDITGQDGFWRSTANDSTIYKYANGANPAQYYLVEALKKDNWLHKSLPDEGLTIWRVNENGDQQQQNNLMVELVHGDNDWSDKEDACFKAGYVDAFSDNTTPNAHWQNGGLSGLDIHSISTVADEMTFITGEGQADPDPDPIQTPIPTRIRTGTQMWTPMLKQIRIRTWKRTPKTPLIRTQPPIPIRITTINPMTMILTPPSTTTRKPTPIPSTATWKQRIRDTLPGIPVWSQKSEGPRMRYPRHRNGHALPHRRDN